MPKEMPPKSLSTATCIAFANWSISKTLSPCPKENSALDPARCWVDVWAFDELVTRIEAMAQRSSDVKEADSTDLSGELLRLYAGHFIEKESQIPWAVAARDELRAKFVRAVAALGTDFERRKEWEQSAALYSRALELDNLAEGLYRRLMISYRELGESAEAMQVYRRCRDMLSIVLGLSPSPETRPSGKFALSLNSMRPGH